MKRHTANMLDAGCAGIFVAGSTGEGPNLTERPWRQAVDAVLEAASGRTPVYVGAIEVCSSELWKTARAERLGRGGCSYHGAILFPPRRRDSSGVFPPPGGCVAGADARLFELQKEVSKLRNFYYQTESVFVSMKAACRLMGTCGDATTLAHAPATPEQEARIREILAAQGIETPNA